MSLEIIYAIHVGIVSIFDKFVFKDVSKVIAAGAFENVGGEIIAGATVARELIERRGG